MRRLVLLIAVALFTLGAGAGNAQTTAPPPAPPAGAVVSVAEAQGITLGPVPSGCGAKAACVSAGEFQRRFAQARRTYAKSDARAAAFGTAIDDIWIQAEGAEEGIVVTPRQVRRRLAWTIRTKFRSRDKYRRYVRRSGMTHADMLLRTRILIFNDRIESRVVAGVPAQQRRSALKACLFAYLARWKSRTVCAPGFSDYRCSNTPPQR